MVFHVAFLDKTFLAVFANKLFNSQVHMEMLNHAKLASEGSAVANQTIVLDSGSLSVWKVLGCLCA